MNKKIAVALSGGVDSAVSAALLHDAGFSVSGIFMKTYEAEDTYADECSWKEDQQAAKQVCDYLGIHFETWNFEREYEQTVLKYFFSELQKGRTPNPDVMCNQDIKFGTFLSKALEKKFDYIATGHYAQLTCVSGRNYKLLRGNDDKKDQSYFLCRVPQSAFEHVLFPIGHMNKQDVRQYARKYGLPNAERKDSQGICFIGKINVTDFIKQHMRVSRGPIVTTDGKQIGTHEGLPLYTIGQREGLKIGGAGQPYYVSEKRLETNELVVVQGRDNKHLYSISCIIEDLVYVAKPDRIPKKILAQIRYGQQAQDATFSLRTDSTAEVTFLSPQWAVTPGQLCAIYTENECLLSGIIFSTVAKVA